MKSYLLHALSVLVLVHLKRPANSRAWGMLVAYAVLVPPALWLAHFRDPITDQEYLRKRRKEQQKRIERGEKYEGPEFCVIGAGFTGLGTMAALKRAGIPFSAYDRADGIGGNWYHGVYQNVNIISSRKTTEFKDFPMPEHYPDFPGAAEMCAYLRSYAKHFELEQHIQLNTEVSFVEPVDAQGNSWKVSFVDGTSKTFGGVVVANGHHWDKRWGGPYTDEHKFEGERIHSKDYKAPEQLAGKRVLVIGCGNSACDVAVEAGRFAKSSDISIRNGTYYIPRTLLGIPTVELLQSWMPLWLQRVGIKLILRFIHGDMTHYGLENPSYRIWDRHPTINSDLLNYIKLGKVSPHKDIDRFLGGKTVQFRDGEQKDFDIIVHATGYHVSIPLVKEGIIEWFQPKRRGKYDHKDGRSYPNLIVNAPLRHKNLYVSGIGQPRYGAGPLITMSSEITALMIETQRELKHPIGYVLSKAGVKPTENYLMDPHAVFTQGVEGFDTIKWLPFLENSWIKFHLADDARFRD